MDSTHSPDQATLLVPLLVPARLKGFQIVLLTHVHTLSEMRPANEPFWFRIVF